MLRGLQSRSGLIPEGLKVRPNRGGTQRLDPQPRQSGDWRSRQPFFCSRLPRRVKGLLKFTFNPHFLQEVSEF